MVSFQCESCGDVLTKKKLDPHRSRCQGATFSCIDCMVHFYGTEYRSHTSCITEDQKYQGALYKNNNKKKVRLNPPSNDETSAPVTNTPNANHKSSVKTPNNKPSMATAVQHYTHASHAAFVEDVPEELESYLVADNDDNTGPSDDDALPHAPTPPPAVEDPVNVFDFLVGATPNASNLELNHVTASGPAVLDEGYGYDVNAFLEPSNFSVSAPKRQLVEYGNSPVPMSAPYQTPAPLVRTERKKKDSATYKEAKKDKKRKRLYLDIHDQVMTDAPPVLHSGLTGGLSRMTTKQIEGLPPSPESAETPASPLKKTRHTKHRSTRTDVANGGNSLLAMLATGHKSSKTAKSKKRKPRASSPATRKTRHSHVHRHHHRTDEERHTDKKKAQKLIEYNPSEGKKDDGDAAEGQMILYKPRADLFLSFVNKGPESERGCSMNKALKRFHRERSSSGTAMDKSLEEKELFRSLRLRKNDRGEIVLFCIDAEE